MRRMISVLSMAALMVAMMVASALSAVAQSQGQGEGAFVIKEGGCSLVEPEVPFVFTENLHSVITPSGNTKLTCHFEGPPIQKTVVGKGFLCGTFLGLTTQSHFVYNKSGNATLTCLINPGANPGS